MICFGDAARQILGKPVQQMLRAVTAASPLPADIAKIVSRRFTFAITLTQQSYYRENRTYQIISVVTSHGQHQAPPALLNSPPVSALPASCGTPTVVPASSSLDTVAEDVSPSSAVSLGDVRRMLCFVSLRLVSTNVVSAYLSLLSFSVLNGRLHRRLMSIQRHLPWSQGESIIDSVVLVRRVSFFSCIYNVGVFGQA